MKESKKLDKIQSGCFLHRTFGSTQLSPPNSLAQGLYRFFVALLIWLANGSPTVKELQSYWRARFDLNSLFLGQREHSWITK